MTIADAYAAPLAVVDDRPWVGLCMVSAIDGSTVVDGRSGGLSSDNDVAVLQTLRSHADVIIVGAATVRQEGYGPPKKDGQRVGVVTRSGSVDLSLPLFTSGAGFVITADNTDLGRAADKDGDTAGPVDVVRAGVDEVDLALAITRLGDVVAQPRFVQIEGGPALNGSFLDVDIFDEINLTTSPLCVGGSGPRLTTGASDHSHRFEVAQLVIDDDSFVYTRWLRKR